jgi:hypothetical protein
MTQEGIRLASITSGKAPTVFLFSFSIQEGFNIQAGSYEKAHEHTLIRCLNSEYWVMSSISAVAKVIDQKLFTAWELGIETPTNSLYMLYILIIYVVQCFAVLWVW